MRARRGTLLCIGLGAVTTLTLAAACSLERVQEMWPKSWEQTAWYSIRFPDKPTGSAGHTETPGASRCMIKFPKRQYDVETTLIKLADLPRWARLPANGDHRLTVTITTGLPLRCMRCVIAGNSVEGGWPTKYKNGISAIPRTPIWSGLTIDTAIWGAAWSLLLVAPGMCRRQLRRRRGRCEACGYDLRGSRGTTCPECGKQDATIIAPSALADPPGA